MHQRGVLLKKVDWKSSNLIVEILTEDDGKCSYIVYSAKKKFFSPVTGSIIEFVTQKGRGDLLSLSDWKVVHAPSTKINDIYAVTFLLIILTKVDIEHESLAQIFYLVEQTLFEIDKKRIPVKLIVSCFLLKFLFLEGLLYLGEMICENCNSVIKKREELYYEYANNKKYCNRCGKKGILSQYNSSILIFINWYIMKSYEDLVGVNLPFKPDEILGFLIEYIDVNLIELEKFHILKKKLTEE